jgi:hypothetical protein
MDPFDYNEREYDEDHYKDVPEEIQEKIRKVILDKLYPAILKYMEASNYPKLRGIAIENIPFEYLCSYRGSLEPAFQKKQQYDLYLMHRHFCSPGELYCNIAGRILVGAAIRISNFIGKQEYADELEEIVRDCFTPEEHPDTLYVKALVPYHCC